MAYQVFISHSSKDRKLAAMICSYLEADQIRCWMAPRDILPGKSWPQSIIKALGECRVQVLVFSEPANTSPQVAREVERAFSKGLVVVPFRIEKIRPNENLEYFLSEKHWLDALTPPVEAHLHELRATVSRILSDAVPPSAPSPADLEADQRFEREFPLVSLDEWGHAPRGGWRAMLSRLIAER
ncbi:MAG: toll/interleukin-1 receptor domain-containing protein [Verrucomicrobiales bacterium]